MGKTSIFIVMAAFILFCYYTYASSIDRYGDPEYCQLVDKLINLHVKEMKSVGCTVTASGGALNDGVNKIIVAFHCSKKPTVEEARLLYVNSVQQFLKQINNYSPIRPYLRNYPFDVKNLDYSISFEKVIVDETGMWPITFVFCIRDSIIYCVRDPTHDLNPLKTVHEETFEAALRIVRYGDFAPRPNPD